MSRRGELAAADVPKRPAAYPPPGLVAGEKARILREAFGALAPGGAEARLRWLVNFSQRDLSAMSDQEWMLERLRMMFIAVDWEWARRDIFGPEKRALGDVDTKQRRVLKVIQMRLRECFDALVRNKPHRVDVPRHAGHWSITRRPPLGSCSERRCPYLKPCPVHSPGRRRGRRTVDNTTTARANFVGWWWLRMVLLSVRLLDEVGAWKLMACPFKKPGDAAPCGRLFLALRRQCYCSIEHSKAAAWHAWLASRGGSRAKS
jgi:hypothetical protein